MVGAEAQLLQVLAATQRLERTSQLVATAIDAVQVPAALERIETAAQLVAVRSCVRLRLYLAGSCERSCES